MFGVVAPVGPQFGQATLVFDGISHVLNLHAPKTSLNIVFVAGTSDTPSKKHTFKFTDKSGIVGLGGFVGMTHGTTFNSHMLTVTKSGTGSGRLTGGFWFTEAILGLAGVAGIDCGAKCTETALHGATGALTPTPDPGSYFAGWLAPGCGSFPTCMVALNANTTVGARFERLFTPPPFVVNVVPGHFHNGPGDSTFYGCISTSPSQALAPFTYTLQEPVGTVTGSGTLDGAGHGTISEPINVFGSYHLEVAVTSGGTTVTGTADHGVGAPQGTAGCA
jgi:hypothetical protein